MSRDQMTYREYYDMPRSVPYGIPEGYRNDYYHMRMRRDFEGGYPPDYGYNMDGRHYPEDYYSYPGQRFEHHGGTMEGIRESKFSNGSDKWDRSNGERRNIGNDLIQNLHVETHRRDPGIISRENDIRKQIRLEEGPGGPPQQSVPSSQVGKLSMQEVESGVRISKGHKDGSGGLSVFHTTGKDSIWTKIDILNKKKLCYDCQKEKWRDKITPLCKECYKSLSNSSGGNSSKKECTYCRIEFLQHRILKKAFKVFNKEICMDCCKNLCKYNTIPVRCHFCDCWSAWNSHLLCDRCSSSREQFGEPLPCDMCRKSCAFDRGEEARKKLDGRLFCFLCTFKYKKLKHEEVKKTNSEYKRAEKTLTKVDLPEIESKNEQNDDKNCFPNLSSTSDSNSKENVDWKIIAQERTILYEKAKQHLAELQAKELSNKIETGSLITQLKESNSNLEKKNKLLEDKILRLNAELNDWQLKLNNICDEKNKQLKLIKDEKRQAIQEMEGLLEKLKSENRELMEQLNSSSNL
ncbi:FAM76 protein [Cryptosporidium hominis]|uniref:FAM76 protein n=1 Tax=Cryptosporidium hominis TaxID=237895 RepID=A0ABX5BCQ5_CRYHO|nr:RIKEN cDNA 2810485I05 [Cryptosporidium hominis TU502]PPS94422.1 FAM76 protein [Cryptosporidium hominis]|eukprot:PPS94422.1 FAM76 protein [Cryptosporidium hominis]